MNVVAVSLRRPVSVIVLFSVLLLFGVLSAVRLQVRLLPTLDLPEIVVVAAYPGMPATEIEQLVSVPLENALSSVEGVVAIETAVQPETTRTVLSFRFGTDMQLALNSVRQAADAVYASLPDGTEYPLVQLRYTNQSPVARLAVTPSGGTEILSIARLVETDIAALFHANASIGTVDVIGVPTEEVQIAVDVHTMTNAGITITDVASIVAQHIVERPIGSVRNGATLEQVIATTDSATLTRVRDIPIRGNALTLSEIASVSVGTQPVTGAFLYDGTPAIGLDVFAAPDAGSLRAARAAEDVAQLVNQRFDGQLSIAIVRSDAPVIARSLRQLLIAMAVGLAAAVVVLYLVYRSPILVSAVVATLGPAVGTVLFAMYIADVSLNLVSLSGIAIGIGMIFDNAIVVADAYIGAGQRDIVGRSSSVSSVLGATTGSTLTTVLVFVPVLFIPGIVGALFSQLAFTLITLIVASFVTSATFVPAVIALLEGKRGPAKELRVPGSSTRAYTRLSGVILEHRWVAAVTIVAVLFAGVVAVRVLPFELVPDLPDEFLEIEIALSPETDVRRSIETAGEISGQLRLLGFERSAMRTGYESDDRFSQANPDSRENRIHVLTRLPFPVTARDLDLWDRRLRELASQYGATNVTVGKPQDPIIRLLGVQEPGSIVLSALERAALERVLRRAIEAGETVSGNVAITHSSETDTAVLRLEIDRNAASVSGITSGQIAGLLSTLLEGAQVGMMRVDERSIDTRVWLGDLHRITPTVLEQFMVPTSGGQTTSLSNIARVVPGSHATLLHRSDRRPSYHTRISAEPAALSATIEAIRAVVPDVRIVAESAIADGGREIATVFIVATVLMLLSLTAQFESFRTAGIVLLSLPVSATGSAIFLLALGKSLNINSLIGVLVMFGTTVNSAILFATVLRNRSPSVVPELAAKRLRPLAATIGTTVAALLPLVLLGVGHDTLESHTATGLLGGLLFGGVVIAICFPALLAPRRYQD